MQLKLFFEFMFHTWKFAQYFFSLCYNSRALSHMSHHLLNSNSLPKCKYYTFQPRLEVSVVLLRYRYICICTWIRRENRREYSRSDKIKESKSERRRLSAYSGLRTGGNRDQKFLLISGRRKKETFHYP
jgi:hypothetical protein